MRLLSALSCTPFERPLMQMPGWYSALTRVFRRIWSIVAATLVHFNRQQGGDASALRLLSRCAVGGRNLLAVVDWEGQHFLVGAGPEPLHLISRLEVKPVARGERASSEKSSDGEDVGLRISLDDWVEERKLKSLLGNRGRRGVAFSRVQRRRVLNPSGSQYRIKSPRRTRALACRVRVNESTSDLGWDGEK